MSKNEKTTTNERTFLQEIYDYTVVKPKPLSEEELDELKSKEIIAIHD